MHLPRSSQPRGIQLREIRLERESEARHLEKLGFILSTMMGQSQSQRAPMNAGPRDHLEWVKPKRDRWAMNE